MTVLAWYQEWRLVCKILLQVFPKAFQVFPTAFRGKLHGDPAQPFVTVEIGCLYKSWER